MDVWRLHCGVSESERSPELELPTTLHHGEAAFWLSRLHEDLSGVGPYWPPELKPAVRNEQEHRNKPALAGAVRMPCELPGLAKTTFAGRALRSKDSALGFHPKLQPCFTRPGPQTSFWLSRANSQGILISLA